MIILSGCNSSTAELNYITAPIQARVNANKELLEKLVEKNIIQQDAYDSVEEALNNKLEQINTTTDNFQKIKDSDSANDVKTQLASDPNLRQILGSIQYFWCPDESAADTYNVTEQAFVGKIFPLMLKKYKKELTVVDDNNKQVQLYSSIPGTEDSAGKSPAPFEILDQQSKDILKTSKGGKIYVLDFDKVAQKMEGGAGASIDQLVRYMSDYAQAISGVTADGKDIEIELNGKKVSKEEFSSQLNNLFVPLTTDGNAPAQDESNIARWFDLSGYNVVKDSILSTDTQYAGMVTDENGITAPADWLDQPGYDIQITNAVTNGGEQKVIAYMRVEELNQAVVDDMIEAVDNAVSDRMLYFDGNFYLFAYPIAYADRFYADGDNFKIEYKVNDQLLLQFKSLTTLKLDSSNAEHATQAEDAYIAVGDGEYNNYSQFILGPKDLKGSVNLAGTKDRGEVSGNAMADQTSSNIPVFVLRDYLEAVYTPGVLNDGEVDEQLVCYGRLIRLNLKGENNATYNTVDPIGYYINQDHDKISATGFQDIYVNQLADGSQLNNPVQNGNTVKRLPQNLEQIGQSLQGDSSAEQVQNLPQEIVQEIHPTLQFPGDLDAWDKDFSSKPQFYAIALAMDLNQSGLLSHWIQSDDEKLSMSWWQSWLNARNYNYKLTTENVNKWINAEYNIQINGKEFVAMDLDKIEEQNKIFQEKYNLDIVSQLRTLAMLIGVVCEIYGAILILAWTFDANIGLGVKMLEKLQFGHWTAIKYKDDGDYYDKSGPMPVTFMDILWKILIIAAVGAALLAFDLSDLIAFLLKLFYGIQSIVERILTGIFG